MRRLKRRPNLVGYFFGEPGGRARLSRPASVGLAAATAASLALLVAVVAGRTLLDVNAMAESAFSPRRGEDGRVVNAYQVSLANHGRAPLSVALELRAPGAETVLRPAAVSLGPGERRQVRVVASTRGLESPGRVPAELVAVAEAAPGRARRQVAPVSIVVPETGR
jgi:hypothetical protein